MNKFFLYSLFCSIFISELAIACTSNSQCNPNAKSCCSIDYSYCQYKTYANCMEDSIPGWAIFLITFGGSFCLIIGIVVACLSIANGR